MIKKIVYFVILLLCCFLHAQHPIYSQFSEKEGLPDIEFYDIMEDAKGFLWLAADNGLYRYDGNQFKNYTNKEKRGLSVFELREDDKGRIWCCNISGQFFYTENEKLITFIDLGEEINWKLGSFLITDTHLLVFAPQFIYKIALDTKKIEARVEITKDLLGNPYRNGNDIYVTTGNSIITLDLELNVTNTFTSKAIYNDLYKKAIGRSTIVGYDGKTYLRFIDRENKSNLYAFDIHTKQYREIQLEEELKNSFIVAINFHKDKMLLATSTGLWEYIIKNDSVVFKDKYFSDLYVSQHIVDSNENHWITTLRNGVVVIPNINNYYYNFSEDIQDVECVAKINDDVFFYGTTNGKAGLYNLKTHTNQRIDLNENSKIDAVMYDDAQQLLYISSQAKAYIYDLKTKTYTTNDVFANVRSMAYLEKNTFLYANYYGAVRVKNGKEDAHIRGVRAYNVYHDTVTKNSYVSCVDDFIKFDQDFKNEKKIRYKGKQIHAVGITKTTDGTVWVATFKDGLYAIQQDSIIKNYATANGLASNSIQAIKSDGKSLWIVINKGIQYFDTETQNIKTLTKSDGISTYLVSEILPFENEVLFATNKGVFSIDRETAFQAKQRPKVYFTGIEINEKDTLIAEEYKLPHYQNAIKLSFNSNGFRSNEHIRYYSRLLGLNEDWIPVDEGIDFVKYNSLPVNDYVFQVKAVSTSLAGESEIAAIKIAIKNPFWKQPWFIIFIVLAVIMITILYYRRLLHKREKQKNKELAQLAQERELVFLKLENLRSQMNPHFIFNALNSIQEYIILNKKNLASDYLGKFADLIRTYLNHSNEGSITLHDEIECLKMYLDLEKLRFEEKLYYMFSIENLDTEAVMIPTMLIQPYVENALKHGLLHRKDNRRLYITMRPATDKNMITCTIEDNGVGRKKALAIKKRKHKIHRSFGTQATQDRLDLLNYGKEKKIGVRIDDLYDENQQPCGTKVTITIPIKNNIQKIHTDHESTHH